MLMAGTTVCADAGSRTDYRNGFYERDYVTRLGTIRFRIARTRQKNFRSARAGDSFSGGPRMWRC